MEFVLPFLQLRDRKNVALTCSYLAQKHREFPFAELTITDATLPYLSRALSVVGVCAESLTLPMCTKLRVEVLADAHLDLPKCESLFLRSKATVRLHAPKLSSLTFEGSRQTFMMLSLGRMDDLDVSFDDTAKPLVLSCRRLRSLCLENVRLYNVDVLTTCPEQRFDGFPGHTLHLFQGTLQRFVNFRGHLTLTNCSFESLHLPTTLKSLAVRDCNMIDTDVGHFPRCDSIDVSDNHTLQQFPQCLMPLVSLNLLHTGVGRQAIVAMEVLANDVTFLGLNVRFEDLADFEQLLQTKRIAQLVVCPSPHIDHHVITLLRRYTFDSCTVHTHSPFCAKKTKRPRCRFYSFAVN